MAPIYIMIDQEETGQNIQHLMHRKGLKVRDVQEACGLEKPQAVYKWIHGQSLPSIDNLLILAKIFGSTVEGIQKRPMINKENKLPERTRKPFMDGVCMTAFLTACRICR